MPNLKDIRRRIKSVKNTEKITQAMRMVAAAKVKRAEAKVKAGRPYAQELQRLFKATYQAMLSSGQRPETALGSKVLKLIESRPVKQVGVLVISSDRGLCGAYNTNLIRQALQYEKILRAEGLEPKFYLVGNKAIQAFNRYSQATVLGKLANMTAAPSIHDAQLIAERLVEAYLAGEIDEIRVLSTHFVSMLSYTVQTTPIVPVQPAEKSSEASSGHDAESHLKNALRAECLLEPSAEAVLEVLIPLYLSNVIYQSLLEAAASELAARMTAMSNATNNAGELIDKLTVVYNKARQASITQEILEVVSGAQAIQ